MPICEFESSLALCLCSEMHWESWPLHALFAHAFMCVSGTCARYCVYREPLARWVADFARWVPAFTTWFCNVSSWFCKSHIFSTACPDPEYNSLPLQWCEQITGPSVVQKNASIPQYDGALALPTSDPWEQWYPRTKLAIFWCHAKPIDRDGAEIHHVY